MLITGASGLLGRAVFSELSANGKELCRILGVAFSRTGDQFQFCDLTDSESVELLLARVRPSAIIHCAAERRPDIVEGQPESAAAINIEATKCLSKLCSSPDGAHQCLLLFISTDYVFDGTSPPYSEESVPSPLNAYGRSKYAGEQIVLGASSLNCVLRVPILYGNVSFLEESAVTSLFSKVCI